MIGQRLAVRCLLAAAAIAITGVPATAAVLALAPTATGDALHVVDVQTLNATLQEAASCCAVQVGSVTADTANQRVFFVANSAAGADLYAFSYGASMAITSVPISAGMRISQLSYDRFRSRLVAVITDAAGGIALATVDPATGNVVVIADLGPNCCTLREGVAAYLPRFNKLYAVGRRSGDSEDQLLAFDLSTGTLAQNTALGALQVAQLVADGNTLYALSYDPAVDSLALDLVSTDPTLGITPIGSAVNKCCFALAGPATIDHANNTLVALVRPTAGSTQFAIMTFSLNSGAFTQGNSVPAMGLFEDTATLSDRIFYDGFE